MERPSRRSWLKHLVGLTIAFLAYWVGHWANEMIDATVPKPITGTAHVTLGALVVEAEGHAAGRATVRGVSASA